MMIIHWKTISFKKLIVFQVNSYKIAKQQKCVSQATFNAAVQPCWFFCKCVSGSVYKTWFYSGIWVSIFECHNLFSGWNAISPPSCDRWQRMELAVETNSSSLLNKQWATIFNSYRYCGVSCCTSGVVGVNSLKTSPTTFAWCHHHKSRSRSHNFYTNSEKPSPEQCNSDQQEVLKMLNNTKHNQEFDDCTINLSNQGIEIFSKDLVAQNGKSLQKSIGGDGKLKNYYQPSAPRNFVVLWDSL